MPRCSTFCAIFLFASLAAAQERRPPEKRTITLPGVQAGGSVQLHNQWSLRPAGRQVELGDFPVNLALHPQGEWLAALHAGHGTHEIVLIHLKTQKVASRVTLDQTFYGLCFSPDGKQLYASGAEYAVVHAFAFDNGLLSAHRKLTVAPESSKNIVGGLTIDSEGKTLYAACPWGDAVVSLATSGGGQPRTMQIDKDSYPYTCLLSADGKRLYVSLWNKAAVAVIEVETGKPSATWPTEPHPTELALAPDGKTLFVACANSTKVSVLNAETGQGLETISCALYPTAPSGNTPNSLCLASDGKVLLVANADANNIAAFSIAEPGKAKPLGFIPVGWYPTSVRYNAAEQRIYVANGRGTSTRANPQGPNPLIRQNRTLQQYIGGLYRGTLAIIEMPSPERMASYSKEAYACSPLKFDQSPSTAAPPGNPIPARLGDPSPIKHVVYVIKENRTYDQVFGDMKEGNGDASLCLFPDRITPNHHKLAREFVLLDNFYVDGEVSADGHEWSMGAYCSDFVRKVWPLTYRGSPLKKLPGYPSEGAVDAIARGAGGYLWDCCAEAGVSYRSYGEWIANGKTANDPGKARVKTLEGHFDPLFRGFDLDYSDVKRADRFIAEWNRLERAGGLPRLSILRLPNDHTAGTRAGKPTPTAFVADNDLALGKVVEAVSKSKSWKDTAIFVVEDDAQNGSDHVDAHRTVALVISPYVRRGSVDSSMYSTSSMLRTMELILGLKPMSQFDAAARPMYASFASKPDLRPYQHLVPQTDLEAKNLASAWGARLSEKFDFAEEDAADDLLLNEVIWRSVRGPKSPMPPPVRAAFVFPHLKDRKD